MGRGDGQETEVDSSALLRSEQVHEFTPDDQLYIDVFDVQVSDEGTVVQAAAYKRADTSVLVAVGEKFTVEKGDDDPDQLYDDALAESVGSVEGALAQILQSKHNFSDDESWDWVDLEVDRSEMPLPR